MEKPFSVLAMPLAQPTCFVNMKHLSTGLISTLLALCVAIPAFGQSTISIHVNSGWNLLSLPASVTEGRTDSLFPTAVSPAYIFNRGSGYQRLDTLHNGPGFWLKFASEQTVVVEGDVVIRDTLVLQAGWNLIGGLSLPVVVDSIQTDPPGIVTAHIFTYVAGVGYRQADTLLPGNGYWVKANQVGSMVLAGIMGLPCPGFPTVSYGGKTYHTAQIGSQCWLRENLDVGIMIPGSENQTNDGTNQKYCYDDNPANCDTYGGLYQWDEAMQYSIVPGGQGFCPPGWHIPTSAEFQTLRSAVGGDGNALKEVGQGSGGGAGTNTSNFSALLAGYRGNGGGFGGLGSFGTFWSSTQYDPTNAFGLALDNNEPFIGVSGGSKSYGHSIRCLKGETPDPPPSEPSNPTPPSGSTGASTSLTLGWVCSDPYGDPLTYDVYFGTDNPPATIVSSNQTGTTLDRSGLGAATTYYWRVVAKDNHDNSTSGSVWSFTTTTNMGFPCPGTPTVTYAGKVYNTVQIGSLCWLKENLDVGDMILGVYNQVNNGTIEKYCYDDIQAKCDTFGGLYQWDEAMQYDTTRGVQGICPPGWHIPTLAQFTSLTATVSGDGNALKEIGQGTGGGAGTNTSGFSVLLAGWRHYSGHHFDYLHSVTAALSSTQDLPLEAYHLRVDEFDANINLNSGNKTYGLSVRCLKDNVTNLPPDAPSNPIPGSGAANVSTFPVLRWSCNDPDGDPLTYDVYFGTDNPPSTMVSTNQTGTTLIRIDLSGSTAYYWKVVARDDHGNSTNGPVWTFTTASMGYPCPGTQTVTYEGKTYTTVQIGSQCWLRENLDVGSMVLGSADQTNNTIIEKYCYDDNPTNCDTYGGLYQWGETVQYDTTTPGARGICPAGWHVPTLAEFQTLGVTVAGDGNSLKEIGQGSGAGAGTNTSGFSALLAGYRLNNGYFNTLGYSGFFWGSTQVDATSADRLYLFSSDAFIALNGTSKTYGFSVRCLED
jgi:uncharacterized protein (TIGR02145 family)